MPPGVCELVLWSVWAGNGTRSTRAEGHAPVLLKKGNMSFVIFSSNMLSSVAHITKSTHTTSSLPMLRSFHYLLNFKVKQK